MIGFISEKEIRVWGQPTLYKAIIVCSQSCFERIFDSLKNIDHQEKSNNNTRHTKVTSENSLAKSTLQSLNYYCVKSDYQELVRRTVFISKTPTPLQENIIREIQEHFERKQSMVVYFEGPTGSGKSLTCCFLAMRLNASFFKEFDPTHKSSSLRSIYTEIAPTRSNPLVICLEETDITIKRIHFGDAQTTKYFRPFLYDKRGWNSMLDDIDNELYPHIVFVMTSNVCKKEIDELDSSYLRKGRIDITCRFHEKIM